MQLYSNATAPPALDAEFWKELLLMKWRPPLRLKAPPLPFVAELLYKTDEVTFANVQAASSLAKKAPAPAKALHSHSTC